MPHLHSVTVAPIRSEAGLSHALARMEELWGAKPGTAAGDELDVLALLVEDVRKARQ